MIGHDERNSRLSQLQSQNSESCFDQLSASHVLCFLSFRRIIHFLGGGQHSKRIQHDQHWLLFVFGKFNILVNNLEDLMTKFLHSCDGENCNARSVNSSFAEHSRSDSLFTVKVKNNRVFSVLQKLFHDSHSEIRFASGTFASECQNLVVRDSAPQGTRKQCIESITSSVDEPIHITHDSFLKS